MIAAKKLEYTRDLPVRKSVDVFVAGGGPAGTFAAVKAAVIAELRRTFRPEFLNRVDETIVFRRLSREDCAEIARRLLAQTVSRAAALGITGLFCGMTNCPRHAVQHRGQGPFFKPEFQGLGIPANPWGVSP